MWFPERPIWDCGACRRAIPNEFIWRSRGSLISRARGRRVPTLILRAYCPHCRIEQSLCVEGSWWRMGLFHLLWRLRYPRFHRGTLVRGEPELHAVAPQKS
jgi:hypothetical protein